MESATLDPARSQDYSGPRGRSPSYTPRPDARDCTARDSAPPPLEAALEYGTMCWSKILRHLDTPSLDEADPP